MSQRWWKPLLQKAAELAKKDGVTFPAHLGMYALRHTSHEIMSISGIEAALIAKLMGHTRVTTTYAI